MKNAHLRFGWLTYVKSTEKTTTSIKLRLDRFIGEVLPDPPRQARAHLISVIGGDTQISAISAAISLGDRFMVEGPCSPSECVSNETRSASKARYSLPGERSLCVTSLACQKSSLRETCLPAREGLCWRARTSDLFGLRSPTSTGYRESRNGRAGLRTNWIRIMH
jgi:hypothetical protein